jgi:hypothetical protein
VPGEPGGDDRDTTAYIEVVADGSGAKPETARGETAAINGWKGAGTAMVTGGVSIDGATAYVVGVADGETAYGEGVADDGVGAKTETSRGETAAINGWKGAGTAMVTGGVGKGNDDGDDRGIVDGAGNGTESTTDTGSMEWAAGWVRKGAPTINGGGGIGNAMVAEGTGNGTGGAC